jgi:starch-binding outer membrane protein, SusD/RagB family
MIRKIFFFSFLSLALVNCTKLEEEYPGNLTQDQISTGGGSAGALLTGAYKSLRTNFQDQARIYALWEITTDAMIAPTRGGDWDDNGAWRVLHTHQFDGDHVRIRETFNDLGGTIYATTDLLRFNPTPQQEAEAKFLRSFASFMMLDGWDQVPYRDRGASLGVSPQVKSGVDAANWIIDTVNSIINNLPDGPATIANKSAARVLLMKLYLNKGVYANRQTPTFAPADMQQVITLADVIINSNRFSFAPNYFDNFAPANTTIGKENIWVQENVGGIDPGGSTARSRYHSTMHYNQQPSGWNGFSTLSDFYNKFEAADKRRGVAYPANDPAYTNPGARVNVGFLVGQQYDMKTGTALKDRTGAPLAFTPQVSLLEKGINLEVTGIRVYKYPIDYVHADNGFIDNDYVFFRLGDVLLMKAEALLRTGQAGPALTIVNQIRTNRGASTLATLTLDNLLDERGRELYLEGWRRQDLVRFGKFLEPWHEKPPSDPKFLVFPVPNGQLAANPNLKQNPGY